MKKLYKSSTKVPTKEEMKRAQEALDCVNRMLKIPERVQARRENLPK